MIPVVSRLNISPDFIFDWNERGIRSESIIVNPKGYDEMSTMRKLFLN